MTDMLWPPALRRADHSDESDSDDDDESGDDVGEIVAIAPPLRFLAKGRRTSVSAEPIDPLRYRGASDRVLTAVDLIGHSADTYVNFLFFYCFSLQLL